MALLTEIALAKTLNLSKVTIRRWRLKEKLPFLKMGHRYYYQFKSVEQWLKEKEAESLSASSKSQPLIYDI